MSPDKRFLNIVESTLIYEGGFVNDPDDPGGKTNFGISQRSYPNLDIQNLTRQQSIDIYYHDYYLKYQFNKIVEYKLAQRVFDFGVNAGPARSIKLLQNAANKTGANLKEDGLIGPLTLNAVNSTRYPGALFAHLFVNMFDYYVGLNKPKYLNGWLNRLGA